MRQGECEKRIRQPAKKCRFRKKRQRGKTGRCSVRKMNKARNRRSKRSRKVTRKKRKQVTKTKLIVERQRIRSARKPWRSRCVSSKRRMNWKLFRFLEEMAGSMAEKAVKDPYIRVMIVVCVYLSSN